ncbi:MAG: aspartate aminotransferase family protein [Spirochaetes bacterium]|nr:aspartate aminotransferase family protein [Spirochaetota bacterium]
MNKLNTIKIEDKYMPKFSVKTKIAIIKGKGVYVWDENGKKYIDMTSGWGVTCIGHANPIITKALIKQSKKIIQNPNGGNTYSQARARLLDLLKDILPHNLSKIFFSSSGAEANDAVIKLARKASQKLNVISTFQSFHGRTISTASATGQDIHRNKFNPLMPNYIFVPFNNIDEVKKVIKNNVAAVIVEPIQGEGGVIVPDEDYLEKLSTVCEENNVYLILDEVQTGFYRTGTLFASSPYKLNVSFMTMAKHIAGGFPFGAFAMKEEIAEELEIGDHGGTYCGNPLGCAVSYEVINYLINNNMEEKIKKVSDFIINYLRELKNRFPDIISDVRGKGLLIAVEVFDDKKAEKLEKFSLDNGLILNVKHGKIIRLFPALTTKLNEIKDALEIIKNAIETV